MAGQLVKWLAIKGTWIVYNLHLKHIEYEWRERIE